MGRPKAITSLKDAPSHGKRNWLIYCDAGVGKTVLAGTAPNSLFLTVEAAGTESAKAMGSKSDEWVTDTWDEIQKAYEWLKNEGHKEYDWVLLDSLSEMEEACWKDQLDSAHASNSSRSLYQPAIADYQIVGNKMKRMVDAFNRLPINVLYTAQAMRISVEDDESLDDTTLLTPLVGSANNGILSGKICGMVTLVGLLQKRSKTNEEGEREEYRRLVTQGTRRYVAKDRHDTFGKGVKNPDIGKMAEAVDARAEQTGSPAAQPKKKKKRAAEADTHNEED